MNLFFLSKTDNLNEDLRSSLKKEIRGYGNKVAYISSAPQTGDRPYYQSTIADYSIINEGIEVDYFDLSENFSDEDLRKLNDYGVIYLSGGNTYVFLDSARKRNLEIILDEHNKKNGVLIGASAGSIMMTPSIEICGSDDANTPRLTDLAAFSFVDFDFHPHYTGEEKEIEFLKKYAAQHGRTLYACPDGSGIHCISNDVERLGGITSFYPDGGNVAAG